MAEILTVSHIDKTFGKNKVVDDISFEVHQGEILGLVGPNGAGKSTIIRCILGIIHPDQGTINYAFARSKQNYRSKIGYLPEERGLYRDVKILHILQYLAELNDYPKEKAHQRALEYMEKFDLKGKEKYKIQELSKGMAQKVQFIAAIIHEPEFLILDEPLSGFDPVSQDLFIDEIKKLAAGGTTILLSSHQMNMVESLCHRIFMINRGQRVLYGELDAMKEQHGNYICEIIGNNTFNFSNLPSVNKVETAGNKTIIHLKNGVTPTLFLQEIPPDLDIKEINMQRASLHDIFVNTVTGGGQR